MFCCILIYNFTFCMNHYVTTNIEISDNCCKARHTLIAKYAKMIEKCNKQKVYSGVFRVTFFRVLHSFFSLFAPESPFARKVKGFRFLSPKSLIKHEIYMKYEKCVVSVSYFMVCFAKTFANAKYKKCIAGLAIITQQNVSNVQCWNFRFFCMFVGQLFLIIHVLITSYNTLQ